MNTLEILAVMYVSGIAALQVRWRFILRPKTQQLAYIYVEPFKAKMTMYILDVVAFIGDITWPVSLPLSFIHQLTQKHKHSAGFVVERWT